MLAQARLVYEAGAWEIDPDRRELRAHGIPVPIGVRAFEIIETLARSGGQLVTKDDLMGRVWPGAIVEENTLAVHISAIRKALGADRAMLKTQFGRGYRLLGHWIPRPDDARADPTSFELAKPPAQPVQGNLPAPASDLIGRDAAVQHLLNLVSAYRVVTLTGAGGIGKSRLALEIAHSSRSGYDGDVWLVELASLSDGGLVAATIAGVLGLDLGPNDISPEPLARAIGRRRLLLVIDNCEHIVDAAATMVATLVSRCPAVSVVATSRELLRIQGECAYRVLPLDVPDQHQTAPGSANSGEASAVRLFIVRMTEQQSDLRHQDELAAVAAICRRLDGIPLAIEFAAARAAALGVGQVLSRLDDRFALLTSGRRTALPKHRTLRATLDWSYELLSAPERLLLRCLAIFVGSFSLEAVSAVVAITEAAITEAATGDAADGIENLIAKSLVATTVVGAEVQFRLLETTRAYALEKLIESGTQPLLARRHAEFYEGLLERFGGKWEVRPADLADLGNVRAALEWCFGAHGDAEIGIRLAAGAAPVFLAMSLLIECHRWSERAIDALDDATRGSSQEMHLQGALGMSLMFTRGESDAARAALGRSLAIAEARAEVFDQSRLLGLLHLFHLRSGDCKAALEFATRNSRLAAGNADPAATALGHFLLGNALYLMGDLEGGRTNLEAALRYRRDPHRRSTGYVGVDSQVMASISLARTLWWQGHQAAGMERIQATVKDAERTDHPMTLGITLQWAAAMFLASGDTRGAEAHIDWFIAHAESRSLGPYVAVGHGLKAALAIRLGDAKGGIESLRDALGKLHAIRYELLSTELTIALAQGLAAVGRFDEATTLIDATIRLAEANGELSYMPELFRVKGRLLLAMPQPDPDHAEGCFMQSLEISRRQGARTWELRTAVDLAALLADRGRSDSARALLRPVFEQFAAGSDTADLRAAERLLASLA